MIQDVRQYYHSIDDALLDAFPFLERTKLQRAGTTITYQQHQILIIVGQYRADLSKVQDFFANFAAIHKFDPLQPSNWYQVTLSQMTAFKVSLSSIYRDHVLKLAGGALGAAALQEHLQGIADELPQYWLRGLQSTQQYVFQSTVTVYHCINMNIAVSARLRNLKSYKKHPCLPLPAVMPD